MIILPYIFSLVLSAGTYAYIANAKNEIIKSIEKSIVSANKIEKLFANDMSDFDERIKVTEDNIKVLKKMMFELRQEYEELVRNFRNLSEDNKTVYNNYLKMESELEKLLKESKESKESKDNKDPKGSKNIIKKSLGL
jgi:ribosomal protein L16 Arg81 hydroxylase